MNRKEKDRVQAVIYNLTSLLQKDNKAVVPVDELLDFLVELKPKEFE